MFLRMLQRLIFIVFDTNTANVQPYLLSLRILVLRKDTKNTKKENEKHKR